MSFNYEDIECPHCGHRERHRFTVETVPFGETTVVGELCHCFKCKEYFYGTVKTLYAGRKLSSYEKNILEEMQKEKPGVYISSLKRRGW